MNKLYNALKELLLHLLKEDKHLTLETLRHILVENLNKEDIELLRHWLKND